MREFYVPPVVTVTDETDLTGPVWRNADNYPTSPQFARRRGTGPAEPAGWEDITCAQFRDEVVGLARGLIAAGIAAGERVGLLCTTRYEWTLIDYAIWAAGAVTVPIYETSSPEQVTWILSDSEAVACFVETGRHRSTVQGLADQLPWLKRVWQIDPDDGGAGALAELTTAGLAVPPEEVDTRRQAIRADDLATIIYTSGTTGRPKGCMLTHRNIYTDPANATPGLDDVFHEGASTLLFLPLAHSFARLIQVGVVQERIRTAFCGDVKQAVPEIQAFRPTFLLAVPRVFERIYNTARQRSHAERKGAIFDRADRVAVAYSEALDSPRGPGLWLRVQHRLFDRLVYGRLRAALGGNCEAAISGGAPLGVRLAHFFRGIGIKVYEGYGLTETSPALAVNQHRHTRLGTVGRPLPGVSIRIAEDGEILARGDVVFAGYWRNPDATAEIKDADGWLRTGDLGALDADGYLSITGRKKELIVTAGGKNVAPAVLEDRIRAHPLVSQCLVVGDRQPFIAALITIDEEAFPAWKEEHGKPAGAGVAALRADPDLRSAIQSAIDEANAAVSTAEAVRVFRILPSDFTETNGMLTPSLKVKRSVVAKEYADEIAAIYR